MIEIDEGVGGPDFRAQLVTGYDLARIPQERTEDLKGLLLKANAGAVFAQFSRGEVGFKDAEAQKAGFAVGGRQRHEGARVVYREAVVGR